jgi:farnesyl-diphosphate farnesyltransferase
MAAPAEMVSAQLTGSVLRSVSRSFYLSIRLLPRRLREPVGLAYLLARATDTLADSSSVPVPIRKENLRILSSAIQNGSSDDSIAEVQRSFAPLQNNESERSLILLLRQCLDRLAQVDQSDRAQIRIVLAKITTAQMLDLERFTDPSKIHALGSAAELQEYTYLIAGCVGEFWTELCTRHVRSFSERSTADMRELGKSYGMGLQLINILRDAQSDLRVGRCYFPADELAGAGLLPTDLVGHPIAVKPIFEKWLSQAENGLKAGMEYVAAIGERRVRTATALPALIGARTIALLRSAGPVALQQKIKVPRQEVRAMLGGVVITLGSRRALADMFQKNLR